MSTYSWSYKTADHLLASAKRSKTEQEGPDKNGVGQIEHDQVCLDTVSSLDNDTSTSVTPKRLNWRAKIYVGNLNKKTNEASLAYYFSVFGDIDDVKLIRDHGTKESRGFAFITFEKIESAEKAKKWCSFNYPTLDDNNITVASAERKSHKIKIPKDEQRAKRDPSKTLFWEFKWNNTSDAQVYGPYETSLLQMWKNQGYFDRGCWVRQVLHHQVNRVEEKQEKRTNVPEESHAEGVQYVNSNISDVKNEECKEVPCKKPKLLIEYSDSDDECDDDKEVMDRVVDGPNVLPGYKDGYFSLKESEKANDPSLNEQHLEVTRNVLLERNEGEDSRLTDKINDSSLNEEHEKWWAANAEKQDDPRLSSNDRSELRERTENPDSLLEVKDVDGVNCNVLQQQEYGHLRLSNTEKQQDVNQKTAKMNEGYVEDKEIQYVQEKVDVLKDEKVKFIQRKDCEGCLNEEIPSGKQFQSQDESNENASREDNVQVNDDENELPILNVTEEQLDIFQMYEQESTVLSEYDKEDERKENDEDLRASDVSSSEEENFELDDDNISTEFVAVSEIDFNLYP